VSKTTTQTSWVASNVTTPSARLTDGQVNGSPLLFVYTKEQNTTGESITSVASVAIASANQNWMIRMQRELYIGSRNGKGYRWRYPSILFGTSYHITRSYVRDVLLVIAVDLVSEAMGWVLWI
jgi:hypothetical protein